MAATINFQVSGVGKSREAKIRDAVLRVFKTTSGRWHVQFIGDYKSEVWELRLSGPGTEASEFLAGAAEQQPESIAAILATLIPAQT